MEINGVINNPPIAGTAAGYPDGASVFARVNSEPSSIALAAKTTRDAVDAASNGEHDAADVTRQAIVALSAAIGSPATAKIVSSAARRSAPLKISHPDIQAPRASHHDKGSATHNTQPVVNLPVHAAPVEHHAAPANPAPQHYKAADSVGKKSNVSVFA